MLYALLTRLPGTQDDLDRFDAGLVSEPVGEDFDPLLAVDDEELQVRAASLMAGRI